MPNDLHYTGGPLDRATILRRDDAWVSTRLADAGTHVIPVWRNNNLIIGGGDPEAVMVSGAAARAMIDMADQIALLGIDGDAAYFAVDLSTHDEPALAPHAGAAEFIDLRQAGALIERRAGTLLAHARGIMFWHRNNRFCANCGHPTESHHGGTIRRCTGPDCGRDHFPRTDPAVIMLVTRPGPDGGACLLARSAHFLAGMYSTLAGFVDQGESLEESVAREVMEEAGIAVTDVRYQASQPWPFPASLMLGFRAQATTFALDFAKDELDDAGWFTRADIARFGERDMRLPRSDSIARWLVDSWLNELPE